MSTLASWVCICSALALCERCGAQDQIELASEIDLPRLVDLSAERLGVNVEYGSRLTGTVTLRLGGGVTDSELWELTNRLLASRGFTTVRAGGSDTLSVVPLSDAGGLAAIEGTEPRTSNASPGFRSVSVRLSNIAPSHLVDSLDPYLSPAGSVEPVPEMSTVIVSDLAPRVAAALRVIETLDASSAALVELPLSHLDATEFLTLVAQLEAKRITAGLRPLGGQAVPSPHGGSVLLIAPPDLLPGWEAMISQLDSRSPVTTKTYTAAFSAAEVGASIERLIGAREVEVVTDELSGSVIVTATPAQHEQVVELLARLGDAPEAVRRPTRTYKLLNRDAAELLGVLQSLVTAGAVSGPTEADPGGGSALSTASPDPSVAEERLTLTSDPATNSIIAIGAPAELERLGALIEDLDVQRPQVLLEVLIISLSDSDALDLGVEIEKLINGPNDTIGKIASIFGLSSTGGESTSIADRGAGLTGIVLNPGDFSVVIRALKTLNEGRSLSMPKVLVASNEQATINSVLEQPYTTINASNTVATTSFGGSSQAGTEVTVTPQIAQGDHLRLEYTVSLSAFVGEAADDSVPPPKQQNNIGSVATIPDGFTIAVGGIELLTEGYAETGLPFISDIPIVGEAFKNRSRSDSRSRFYVFIRPTILRDRNFEALRYISERDLDELGLDDGWPEVRPRIIK